MEVYCGQYYQNIFSWAKYKIFMGKHKISMSKNHMFRSQHVFIVKTHYALANIFSWAKYNIFMGKAPSFHGKTELHVITHLIGVVLSFSVCQKWVGREKGLH